PSTSEKGLSRADATDRCGRAAAGARAATVSRRARHSSSRISAFSVPRRARMPDTRAAQSRTSKPPVSALRPAAMRRGPGAGTPRLDYRRAGGVRSGRTPRQRDKTLDRTETHEADEKTPSSRPIDAQRGEPERQARIEVRRVGDPLHLLDGAFDVVAPADVERGRVERGAPLRARVGKPEVRLGDRLDRREDVVLAARRWIEQA